MCEFLSDVKCSPTRVARSRCWFGSRIRVKIPINSPIYSTLLNSQPWIMQFSLSDWFTVSRLPAIIPTFDLIWKLMRQMSIFFHWEAKFCRQKMDEKTTNWESCLQRNTRNHGQCRPSSNEKAMKFRMRIFNGTVATFQIQ